jgi:hypothetical protein
MRQARGAVAGLEQRLVLAGPFEPLDELARLLERPGICRPGGFKEGGIEGQRLRHGIWTVAMRAAP